MWEAIGNVLTSGNGILIIIGLLILCVIIIRLSKTGHLVISTKAVRLGAGENERTIIRNQSDYAYMYCMSLESKVIEMTEKSKLSIYMTRYALERTYDTIAQWIMFNHIEDSERYIKVKQRVIISLIYSLGVPAQFKTPEFKGCMEQWVEEAIKNLVEIRKLYSK